MQVHNFEQGTEEWLKVRLGKLTASDFHTLMGNSVTKETILYKKAAERLTGVCSDGDNFSTLHTERGHQLEDNARNAYELEKGVEIKRIGFAELNSFVGCSPDGLVADGGVEVKCKDNHNFLKAVLKNWIEPAHKTQMQFIMYVCDLKWMDYCLYNSNFPNPLFVIRVERDDEYIGKIKTEIEACNDKINNFIKQFGGINE